MKILFVENHEVFARMAIAQFLSAHEVTLDPSLREAERALKAQEFSVILVDYDLDDGKGDALVRALRGAGARVAIVGVSAKEEGNQALRAAGASATCGKLDLHKLPALLEALLRG